MKQKPTPPIFGGLGPQITTQDVHTACAFLCSPWRWNMLREGCAVETLETQISRIVQVPYVRTFDSGRSALQAAFFALSLAPGDEVLVQAYTCVVVINAICASGAVPVYVDVDDSCTMDPRDMEKKIRQKTRAVIIQHTFGAIANIQTLTAIAEQHRLAVIEDCAHVFGVQYMGKPVGSFGDMSILSFGSEKMISSGRGGALCVRNTVYRDRLSSFHAALPLTPRFFIVQQLISFLLISLGKKIYTKGGKVLLFIGSKVRLLSKIISATEKEGIIPQWMPAQFSHVYAVLLLKKIKNLELFNRHREDIARVYDTILAPNIKRQIRQYSGIYLEYPIYVDDPIGIAKKMKQHGIYLNTSWLGTNIVPVGVLPQATKYTTGTCPNAERIAHTVLNLPTHQGITRESATLIAQYINTYARQTHIS